MHKSLSKRYINMVLYRANVASLTAQDSLISLIICTQISSILEGRELFIFVYTCDRQFMITELQTERGRYNFIIYQHSYFYHIL